MVNYKCEEDNKKRRTKEASCNKKKRLVYLDYNRFTLGANFLYRLLHKHRFNRDGPTIFFTFLFCTTFYLVYYVY